MVKNGVIQWSDAVHHLRQCLTLSLVYKRPLYTDGVKLAALRNYLDILRNTLNVSVR